MNCQRCGYLIPDTAAFCPNCGAQEPAVNTPQQAAQAAQYPPNPYLQTPYPQPQANPPQGYAPPQPQFQQTPYPPQYPQPPAYPAQPPVRQQSKGVRILIIVVSLLSMIVGLLKIFRVFR